ncbi:hypothetical protein GOBAR_AA36378 [Gossypium barbadense]|uniref:Uncharacterized protein n=1 Tax=Gossypium barbadense TaxID=3634 RepID=A0A2P5VZS2_GOSBA|nr:hypothetical protein GOBAR_AA36378 [Gossypium barbadense]
MSQSRVAIGGVIRGPQRGWLVGFGMVTGLVDIFQVEAKVMLEGLKLAYERGFRQRKSDCCTLGLLKIGKKLRLLSKDGNRVTNYLAKEILGSLNQLIILDEPSIYV